MSDEPCGVYYNEFDAHAAGWLANLQAASLIPQGKIDTRSIHDVSADDVRGYRTCQWFAGIAGWSLALDLAGWPRDWPVWTGSCPCQPFSVNGKGQAENDHRHLWPDFFRLIRECRPDTIFGEQVDRAVGHEWLDLVSADLEGEGYAVGAKVLGSHSVGAQDIRQRLYWVADTQHDRMEIGRRVENTSPTSDRRSRVCESLSSGVQVETAEMVGRTGVARHDWQREPSPRWLAHGISQGLGVIRGFGNAINPYVGAEFIRAFMDTKEDE